MLSLTSTSAHTPAPVNCEAFVRLPISISTLLAGRGMPAAVPVEEEEKEEGLPPRARIIVKGAEIVLCFCFVGVLSAAAHASNASASIVGSETYLR